MNANDENSSNGKQLNGRMKAYRIRR